MDVEPVDELEQALRESRHRFVSGFADRCDELRARISAGESTADVQSRVHRLVGLAGTIGFPTVSERASDLEEYLQSADPLDQVAALRMVEALCEAFAADSTAALDGATGRGVASTGDSAIPILLVEDDPDQAAILKAAIDHAGFQVTVLHSAETLLEVGLALTPSVVILDVMLPGIDGLLACRLLKTEPALARIPVVFISSRTALDERLAAVALGAEDYLTKPLDLAEVVFRLRRLVTRTQAVVPPPQGESSVTTHTELQPYALFTPAASAVLANSPASLALIRVPALARPQLLTALLPELRRRDLLGDYDPTHVVLLFPELPATSTVARLRPLLQSLRDQHVDVRAGVADTSAGGTPLSDLLTSADNALTEARFKGLVLARHGEVAHDLDKFETHRVLLADDDPDVMRIVDAQMRAQHFQTTLVFDGLAAVAALSAQPFDLAVLDLMLPKLTGFEVLQRIRDLPHPPRVVVLSARGREEDITRAFQLGADDYITKPFRPQELAARVVRLLR